MRVAASLLCVFCTGMAFQSPATDLEEQSQPPSQSSPAPVEPEATAAPVGEQGAVLPSSPAPAEPAAPDNGGNILRTREEADIISRGYQVEMRHGQKWFCRRESEIGSRFERKTCATAESILARRAASEEAVRKIQVNKPALSN